MSRRWLRLHKAEFVRDVVRDYCFVCAELDAQFTRFARSQTISFPVMRDLLGTAMNKGLLWRLKDTAHHLFRQNNAFDQNNNPLNPLSHMLDWSIGYVFHECIKLKEDAYQYQQYAPQYKTLRSMLLDESLQAVVDPLEITLGQTCESMEREIKRIRYILASSRKLLSLYLHAHKDNVLLARFIYDNNTLVRDAFCDEYASLLSSLYGEKPQQLHCYAAHALMDGGRQKEALRAMESALELYPQCQEVQKLYVQIQAHSGLGTT